MICPYCSMELEGGVVFCPYCGGQIGEAPTYLYQSEQGEQLTMEQHNNAFPEQPEQKGAPKKQSIRQFYKKAKTGGLKTTIVLCLLASVLLIAGAVYLIVFHDASVPYDEQREEVEVAVQADYDVTGTWANDDHYLIFTSGGAFAADGETGRYACSGSTITVSIGDTIVSGAYSVTDGVLTLNLITDEGATERQYVYLSGRVTLTESEIHQLYEQQQTE